MLHLLLLWPVLLLPTILHRRLLLRPRVPTARGLRIAVLGIIAHRIRRLVVRLPVILMLGLMMLLVVISLLR